MSADTEKFKAQIQKPGLMNKIKPALLGLKPEISKTDMKLSQKSKITKSNSIS